MPDKELLNLFSVFSSLIDFGKLYQSKTLRKTHESTPSCAGIAGKLPCLNILEFLSEYNFHSSKMGLFRSLT